MSNVLQIFKHLSTVSARCNILQNYVAGTCVSQVRTLYSPLSLGMESYVNQRQRTGTQLGSITDKFRTKMEEYTSEDSRNMIFTEDLKNMVHLAQAEDVPLIVKMMNKFNEQNKELRFGTFIFGPVVMRLFHHLNKPLEALECFTSPKLAGFFDQLITYQVLMDLLFRNAMYKEMLQTFENIQSRQIEGHKFPRNIIVLTLAACYKINTNDSYSYALNLWNELKENGHRPMRRAVTFISALALKMGAPEMCLEIVSSTLNQNYVTVRNLKVLALARIGRHDEALLILRGALEHEDAKTKYTFNKEVVNEIKELIHKEGNTERVQEMNRMEKYFLEQGHLTDATIDEDLCEEIKTAQNLPRSFDQRNDFQYRNQHNRYNLDRQSSSDRRRDFQPRRPGLSEL